MSRMIAIPATACAALLLLHAVAGCPGAKARARVVGNTVYLPAASSLLAFERKTPEQMPFVRFDGVYPARWPDAAKLPEGSYLTPDGRADGKQTDYYYLARFDGICRGSPEGVMTDWLSRITDAGWILKYMNDDKGAAYPTAKIDGDLTITADMPGARPATAYMQLTVHKHTNMDGWVHFSGMFLINNMYL